jgi:oligogalacturonide transport system substrate-binding protein
MKKRESKLKKVLSVIVTVGLVLSLSACGTSNSQPSGSNKNGTGTKTTSGGTVTLRFGWWGGDARHKPTLKAIELYEKKHPNIKIDGEYQGYDGYYEKLMTTLSSGTAPDFFQFSRDWIADVQGAHHYLADLSKLPVNTSTLKKGLLEKAGIYNGQPVFFPATVGGQVIYVNSDFASKNGIDLSKQYTWTELMDLGKKIHTKDAGSYLMTADIDVLNRLIVLSYLSQQTGKSLVDQDSYKLNFTEGQMASSLQNIVDLYKTNTLEPFGEAAAFVGQIDQNSKWINGKIGTVFDNTGSFPKYKVSIPGKIDVMKIPTIKNAKCSGVDYSSNMGFSINDNSPHKDEAAKFLDFMMNDPEAIEILQTCRGYCPTDIGEKTLQEKGILDATQKKAMSLIQPNSYNINTVSGNTELETVRKDVIQEVVYGNKTPVEGAKEIVEQYNGILKKLKAKK